MDRERRGASCKAPSPIVELKGISKRYSGETRLALAGIDLAIYPGEFLAIVGPSGAGKTTLLHILGLLDRPSKGQVLTMGLSANDLREEVRAELRNGFLGFVFQFHFLLSDLTVWENVLLPLLITAKKGSIAPRPAPDRDLGGFRFRWGSGIKEELLAEKVDKMLRATGLLDKAHNLPEELSGGERQRVAVARALVTDPPLVLADEPTGNLDTANAKLVWELLAKANAQQGTAIVAITHNEELAMGAQRILRIVDGRIVEEKASFRSSSQCDE